MRRTLILLVAILAACIVAAPVSSADGGSVFNVPEPYGGNDANYRIIDRIERAVEGTRPTKAEPHPVIHIATYLMDHSPVVSALVRACRRGVSVRVILDEDIDNWNSRRLITALNADNVPDKNGDGKPDRKPHAGRCNRELPGHKGGKNDHGADEQPDATDDADDVQLDTFSVPQAQASVQAPLDDSVTWGKDGSYVKKCEGSCRGRGGNMHSKFYLFSKTRASTDVVMVSSSNLNRGGAELGWNDLFVVKGRAKLYRGFRDVHRLMTDDVRAKGHRVQVDAGPFTARFFPMRNAGKAVDPTLRDLERIRCHGGFGRTRIHVSMFYWKGVRGAYLLDELVSLAHQGCRVSIVYGAPSMALAERMRKLARNHVIDLWDSRRDHVKNGTIEVRTHAKYVLVKGRIGKDRRAFGVWTGSQNWVAGSLSRGDETTLNIGLRSAYVRYRDNWDAIRDHSRRLPYDVYGH